MKKGMIKLFWFVNIVLYLVTVAVWISIPEVLTLNISVSVFSLCLTAVLIICDRERFEILYSSPQFKKMMATILSAFLIFCILGVVNYLFFKHPLKLDVTKIKANSLTEESVLLMKKLKGPVSATVFARKNEALAILPLVELYRFEKSDISIDVVDVELRPDLVKTVGITKSGSILFEYKGRQIVVDEISELDITNAMIKLARKRDPVVIFTSGHGEWSIDEKKKEGISRIKNFLEASYFDIRQVGLASITDLPPHLDLLVIWGPKTAFMEGEIGMVKRFLDRGGKLLIALDPSFKDDKSGSLRALVQKWGIKVANDIVMDRIRHISGSNGTVPMVDKIKNDHPSLSGVSGPVFFPLASSVSKLEVPGLEGDVTTMINTTHFPASWADSDPSELVNGKVTFSADNDTRGPVSLMAVYDETGKTKPVKIAVFGNSTFIQNSYAKFGKNYKLFLNTASWLVSDDLIDSFNLPIGRNDPIVMSTPQIGIIFYFSVIFPPVILFGLALFTYKRKRNS